jgi:hypothetical protein
MKMDKVELSAYPNNSATNLIRRCSCRTRNRYSDRFLAVLR